MPLAALGITLVALVVTSSTSESARKLSTVKLWLDQHLRDVGGWCESDHMDDSSGILEQINSLLSSLVRLSMVGLSDEDLCLFTVEVEQAGRLLDSLRVRSAAEIDERSRFELGSAGLSYRLGHRRGVHLIEQLTLVSSATAASRIRLGAVIRPRQSIDGQALPPHYEHVGAALDAGAVGMDAAAVIIRMLEQAAPRTLHPELLEPAERYLVEVATTESADLVAIQARVQREALDPDGAPQRDEDLRARRAFRLGREQHGVTPFSGACDPVSAALLRAAFSESLAPAAQPRFLSAEDRAAVAAEEVDDIPDPRSRDQRQHDIVFGLITAGIRSPGLRSTTTVMAVVKLEDFESGRGVGWLDDVDEPVSAATVQELACDSGLRRIMLGEHGEILAHGMLERFFTSSQRRALAVRDGGCVWPHCTAPPGWCQAHHVTEYDAGGETNVDNGVLLCSAHHHMLHASAFTMKMANGRPRLPAPVWIDPAQRWRTLGRSRVTMTTTISGGMRR